MKKVLIILFISFLFTPMAGLVFNIQDGLENTEKRNMAAFPKFTTIENFTDGFLKYYEDNFGFRYTLIRFCTNLKVKLFKCYPKNIDLKVLKGKDGWLFYKLGNEIEDFEGKVPFSIEKLNKIKENYAKRAKNLYPTKFYVLIPPDKTVIYEEFLPNAVLEKKNIEKSRITGLLKVCPDIIYPKEILFKNKNQDETLYFKGDTHWTYLGAYFGYSGLIAEIKKDYDVKSLSLNDFERKEYENLSPDLTEIVSAGKKKDENSEKSFMYTCKNKPENSLKVLVFGDSFYKYLKPYLECTFNDVKFINSSTVDRETVKTFNPDIVILEIVQRNLRHLENRD